ncbi:MAG: radical SAM protein, partial [Bacilli bacterium]
MIESLLLEITNRCNKKCSFCYSNFESNGCDVDWATLENELRYMKENQIDEVVLSGGEPLLCRNFEEVLCTLYNHKKNITILSNGIALSNHNINLISEYNCKV